MTVREQQDCAEKNTYVNKNKGSVHLHDQDYYKKIVTGEKKRFKL